MPKCAVVNGGFKEFTTAKMCRTSINSKSLCLNGKREDREGRFFARAIVIRHDERREEWQTKNWF